MNIAVKQQSKDSLVRVFTDTSGLKQSEAVEQIDAHISIAKSFLAELEVNKHETLSGIILNLSMAKAEILELIKNKAEFPFPNDYMRQVNNGNRCGNSRDEIVDRLMFLQGQRVALKGGKISWKSIFKGAASMQDALAWLEMNIAEGNCAAKSSALINSINSAKYATTLVRIKNGHGDLYISDEEIELRRELKVLSEPKKAVKGAHAIDRSSSGLECLATNNAFIVLN